MKNQILEITLGTMIFFYEDNPAGQDGYGLVDTPAEATRLDDAGVSRVKAMLSGGTHYERALVIPDWKIRAIAV